MNRLARLAGAVVVAGAGSWAVRDYRAWRSLGEGGLPANPGGWLITTALRALARDPFQVSGQSTHDSHGGHGLAELAARGGDRPRVAPYPIPHRVLAAPSAEPVLRAVAELLDELADTPALCYRTSRWERHNQALWLTGTDHEIGHLHPSDGSLHVVLAPADAQTAIDLGWGQLHPLAGVPRLGLPAGYTLLYPPRSIADLAAIRTLLDAARHHATAP